MNILLIDDNCILLESLTLLLQCNGHTVITAENGSEALQKAEQEYDQIDAVVTDYMMPVMNGMEFLQCFKSKWPLIPVIVMTGSSIDEEVWYNLGVFSIIYKPVAIEKLLLLLQALSHKNPANIEPIYCS